MSWAYMQLEIARKLGIKAIDPSKSGALAVVRSGAELARHSMSPEMLERLHTWARLVDPTVPAPLAKRLVQEWPLTAYPAWLSALRTSNDASPPIVIVLALLLMLPASSRSTDPAQQYVDAAARQLGISSESLAMLTGWLHGTSSQQVDAEIDALLATLARVEWTQEIIAVARDHASDAQATRYEMRNFHTARDALRLKLTRIHASAIALELDESIHGRSSRLGRVTERFESDLFRVAVLGEFKRGKSTLINGLLGTERLLPVDRLPSTSALIEVRYGEALTYEKWDPVERTSTPHSAEEFLRGAGAAHAENSPTRGEDLNTALSVPRWRVTVPSAFLRETFLELIDSPGLGEDIHRDAIAKLEAHRADAAVLVLSAEQITSLQELGLITAMASKADGLILAINAAYGHITAADQEALVNHVEKRLADRGVCIPRARIVFVAPTVATREWLAQTEALRQLIASHLVGRCAPRKARSLVVEALSVVGELREVTTGRVRAHRNNLEEIERLGARAAESERMYVEAQREIVDVVVTLRQSDAAAHGLVRAYEDDLPDLLARLECTKDEWTSKQSLLTSPRRHVEEVGTKAQQHMAVILREWTGGLPVAVLGREIMSALDGASARLTRLSAFIERVRGVSAEPAIAELRTRALLESVGAAELNANTEVGGVGLRMAVAAAVQLVIGYIVADIVLFYVLGAISSFVALPLLVAAVVGGIALHLIKGDDWVRGWIRSVVFEKFRNALEKPEAGARIKDALAKAARDTFARISHAFEIAATELLADLHAIHRSALTELERRKAELGDADALARELQRVEECSVEMMRELDDFEELSKTIRGGAPQSAT